MKAFSILLVTCLSVTVSLAVDIGEPGFHFDCSGKVDGNYPHPTKCTHYVACVAETYAYEMVCAMNHDGKPLHYVQNSGPDPAKSRCDYPEVAGCDDCTCSNKDIFGTPGFHYDCSNKDDGNYPHPTKCDHYVACVAHEHAYEMPCAMGHNGQRLHYVKNSGPDPSKSRCDYPEVAGCKCSCDCGCSNKDVFGTPGFHYDCSQKVDGNYPHPTKCDHYVACVAREHAYEMPCAMGHDGQRLHYVQNSGPDPAKSRCDYPEIAGCNCGCSKF